MNAPEHVVRGLRAAARATGRSASGVQRLVDTGRLAARKDGAVFEFSLTDLAAVRRAEPGVPSTAADVSSETRTDVSGAPTPPPVDHLGQSSGRPLSTERSVDEGAVAAMAFADFQGGKSIVDVVIDRRLPPDVVRRFHGEWIALSDVDTLKKPEAEARLAQIEADIRTLDGQVGGVEGAFAQVARGRQDIENRLLGLERRGSMAGVPSTVFQRLDTLERQIRTLPAAPLLLGRRCTCGHPLAVAACCPGCGAGRVAS